MRFRLRACAFFLLLLAASPLTAAYAFAANQPMPVVDPQADHNACVAKGLFLGKLEDPGTEKYYRCRADLVSKRLIRPASLVDKLTPEQERYNSTLLTMLKDFDTKAGVAHGQVGQPDKSAMQRWEDQQSESAKRFDRQDHNACVSEGHPPTSWANPDTEKYYLCRAGLIEQRASNAMVKGQNFEKKSPEAALFFYRKAQEAQYAFKAKDYETHYICLEKGYMPAEPDDPRTEGYYRCRAENAADLGPRLTEVFRKRADKAHQATLDARPCVSRGLKRGTAEYTSCVAAAGQYKTCLSNIPTQLEEHKKKDTRLCREEAELKFPSQLTKGVSRKVVTLDSYDKTTSTTITEAPRYSKAALQNARSRAYKLCMEEKESEIAQYAATLKLQCADSASPDRIR